MLVSPSSPFYAAGEEQSSGDGEEGQSSDEEARYAWTKTKPARPTTSADTSGKDNQSGNTNMRVSPTTTAPTPRDDQSTSTSPKVISRQEKEKADDNQSTSTSPNVTSRKEKEKDDDNSEVV